MILADVNVSEEMASIYGLKLAKTAKRNNVAGDVVQANLKNFSFRWLMQGTHPAASPHHFLFCACCPAISLSAHSPTIYDRPPLPSIPKKSGGMKRSFVESFTIRGNGKDPTKTVYSCHTRKDQSHPPTFTVDWFLREGQGRELLGEWMKKTAVRSQDQRRMLQANSHTFPTNSWIHKITKGRESDRYDL